MREKEARKRGKKKSLHKLILFKWSFWRTLLVGRGYFWMEVVTNNRDENMYGQIVIDHISNLFSCHSKLIYLFFKNVKKVTFK